MGRYRKIDPRIWNDEKFRRLSDDGKLAFLFLLTHPAMTAIGAMRATWAGLAAELGWTAGRWTRAINRVEQLDMVEVNAGAAYVGLPRWLRYNEPEGPNSVKHAWAAALDLVPECAERHALARRCLAYLENLTSEFRKAMGDAILDAFRDAIGDAKAQPSQIQEQELELEHELEQKTELKAVSNGQVESLNPKTSVARVVDAYRALSVASAHSDSGTIASLVKRYGADVVLKAITSAGPDIVKAYNPLSYLCGTVRRRANVAKADALTAKLAGEMTLR